MGPGRGKRSQGGVNCSRGKWLLEGGGKLPQSRIICSWGGLRAPGRGYVAPWGGGSGHGGRKSGPRGGLSSSCGG